MKIIFNWKNLILKDETGQSITQYSASCKVRTELNGRRKKNQVQYTIPEKPSKPKPYYPRQFPSGIFEITEVMYTADPEYSPVKIKTNAVREVFTWDLDREGNYWQPTGKTQIDTCYWLHYTDSSTTLGCIRIGSPQDAMSLAAIIEEELKNGNKIMLEVL